MDDLYAYIEQLKAEPALSHLLAPLFELIDRQAQHITHLEAELTHLRAEAGQLRAEVKHLRAQLGQNSTNSHKPPSSDPYRTASVLPKAKTGPRGGQPGHRGETLEMSTCPDQVIRLHPEYCQGCGLPLEGIEPEQVERRQVIDIPPPRFHVREYQRAQCRCPACGWVGHAAFPEEVSAPVQYGHGVRALATLWHSDYHLPVAKISHLFEDLFGHRVNEATVLAANRRTAAALGASEAAIRAQLARAEVAHADETSVRCAEGLQWVHVFSTAKLTSYFVHPKRGRAALRSPASVLPQFRGCLIHDCWASYFGVHPGRHGLCNAHILRELQALSEQGADWAEALKEVLVEGYRHAQVHGTVPDAVYYRLKQRYYGWLRQGLAAHPMPGRAPGVVTGRKKRGKARSLLRRLIQHQAAVWRFAREAQVPFTNNQAERDVRMVKLKQKITGGFRTEAGVRLFVRVRGYCSTARKQGVPVYEALVRALQEPGYLLVPFPT